MRDKKNKKSPKTKLKFAELLGEHSISKLARHMGVTYTQLYPYKRKGANPTLLVLEQLAVGLSELRNEEITVSDLLGIAGDMDSTKKRKPKAG